MNTKQLVKGKKVLVFGLGLQGGGVGDALWLHAHGAEVRVTDLKQESSLASSLAKLPADISRTLGGHSNTDIDWADLIIKNPGVPDSSPQLQYAAQLTKPIYTSIALVVQEARGKVIGITGTRGKSTTTELIFTLLDSLYPGEVIKGGNLAGTSGLALLDQLADARYLVLELSSFQLAGFHNLTISPHWSILTNIYPDHLNRYSDMVAYQRDKAAIYQYQTDSDYLIVNRDNQLALSMAQSAPSKQLTYSATDFPSDWTSNLLGTHNRENIAAVIALAQVLKIDIEQVKKIVEDFHALEFRLQLVREVGGVKYYNDTTSTTPTATIKALSAMTQPTIIILGGDDKQLPYEDLITTLQDSQELKSIILLGCQHIPEFVSTLEDKLGDVIVGQVDSMDSAVELAHSLAESGDTVLLSPGFASFDLFKNEFDRGRQFNKLINNLS